MIAYPPRRRLHDPIGWRMCLSYGMSGLLFAIVYVGSAPIYI